MRTQSVYTTTPIYPFTKSYKLIISIISKGILTPHRPPRSGRTLFCFWAVRSQPLERGYCHGPGSSDHVLKCFWVLLVFLGFVSIMGFVLIYSFFPLCHIMPYLSQLSPQSSPVCCCIPRISYGFWSCHVYQVYYCISSSPFVFSLVFMYFYL